MSSSRLKISCVALGSALALSAISAVAAPSTHLSSPIVVQPPLRMSSSPIVVQPPLRKNGFSPIVVQPPLRKNAAVSPIVVQPPLRKNASSPIVVQPPLRNNAALADRCAAAVAQECQPSRRSLCSRRCARTPAHRLLCSRRCVRRLPVSFFFWGRLTVTVRVKSCFCLCVLGRQR